MPRGEGRRRWRHAIACPTLFIILAGFAYGDVSVTASVDQSRIAFGESVTFTIAVLVANECLRYRKCNVLLGKRLHAVKKLLGQGREKPRSGSASL